ncbi:hypothetical protein CVT24_000345 [Panaeolus cyanescens]|uniref:Uncharacterized protein n=1 Tax=Panaeolus cyanescens TaxID=181874 RepID=A0A409YCY2_9AGAR|nr:hypothetical protein CVT24_000345 [Panaeolus cyanescens]
MSVETGNHDDMIMDVDEEYSRFIIPFTTLVLDQIPSSVTLCKTPALRYIVNTFYVMFINYPPLLREDWQAFGRVLFSLNNTLLEIEDIVSVWDVAGTDRGSVRKWGDLAHQIFIQLLKFFPDEIEFPDLFDVLKQYVDDPKGAVIEGIELTPDPEALHKLELEREMDRQAGVEEARMILITRRLSPERPRRRKQSYSTGQSKDKHTSPPKVPSKLRYSLPQEWEVENWLMNESDDSD